MNSNRVLIVYATRYGQAELIARRIAGAAQEWRTETTVQDIRNTTPRDLAIHQTIILVASVYYGKHQRLVRRFVTENRARLAQMHSAFISVSGAAGEIETRPQAAEYLKAFFRATGWTANETLLAGGAVKFSRYNFLLRFFMKRIAASKGKTLDPHRDYESTDWEDVMRFARAFLTSPAVKVA